MKRNSKLYRQTKLRVGPEEMRGVERLLDDKHRGIAERHTVEKLFSYVEMLEEKLGISYDDNGERTQEKTDPRLIKINKGGVSRYM